MESNTENICTDYIGNPLAVGDEVVVKASGNTSWRKGVVTKILDDGKYDEYNNRRVQVEYNDHWYCNMAEYMLRKADPKDIVFKQKPVKIAVSTYSVIKLLPEYLEQAKEEIPEKKVSPYHGYMYWKGMMLYRETGTKKFFYGGVRLPARVKTYDDGMHFIDKHIYPKLKELPDFYATEFAKAGEYDLTAFNDDGVKRSLIDNVNVMEITNKAIEIVKRAVEEHRLTD